MAIGEAITVCDSYQGATIVLLSHISIHGIGINSQLWPFERKDENPISPVTSNAAFQLTDRCDLFRAVVLSPNW